MPFAAADKIRLTVKMVQEQICVPTKSGKVCSWKDALKFTMLCQSQRLNPWSGDAYLVGYDSQDGPSFSLITSHAAFLKRAEACADYEGMDSGIILLVDEETGEVKEREGDFHLAAEKVVGGWARVFRKGRRPTYRRLRMDRFNKGFAEWRKDPAGMIVKCSEADALRSTFPSLLGGLYTDNESVIVDIQSTRVAATPAAQSGLVEVVKATTIDDPVQQREPEQTKPEPDKDPTTPLPPTPPNGKDSPSTELGRVVVEAGYNFDVFAKWGAESGNVPKVDSMADFSEVPEKVAERLLVGKRAMLKALGIMKETLI